MKTINVLNLETGDLHTKQVHKYFTAHTQNFAVVSYDGNLFCAVHIRTGLVINQTVTKSIDLSHSKTLEKLNELRNVNFYINELEARAYYQKLNLEFPPNGESENGGQRP